MTSQFDAEGRYFAQLSNDGKLKIWNTASNSLEQEYVPDIHLASPCTCLQFVVCLEGSSRNASPKPKRKKTNNTGLEIVLGLSSGKLLIYSISKGDIRCTIDGNINLPVSCLSSNCGAVIYSGIDENIVVWNIQQREIVRKWKAGNNCITAILAVPSLKRLLTASKSIKLWNMKDQTLLKTFKGHSSDVNLLLSVPSHDTESSYVISGSKSDRLLNCWNINEEVRDVHASTSLLLEDCVTNVSLNSNGQGATTVSASIANGAVHIFEIVLNGKCNKPTKPKSTIRVLADTGQKDIIIPILIVSTHIRNEQTVLLAYGSSVLLKFEELEPNRKLICLVRQHPHTQNQNELLQTNKVITLVEGNATYLTPVSNVTTGTKRKLNGAPEVTFEKRLENLTLSQEDVPKSNNMARLLLQGLRSKDPSIIKTVMITTNEEMIKNTVRRLPVDIIDDLMEQICIYMQGNHIEMRAATVWVHHLFDTHFGWFSCLPDFGTRFSNIRNVMENQLAHYNEEKMFLAKLNLMVSEIDKSENYEEDEDDALVFNDRDTSSESEEESTNSDTSRESEEEFINSEDMEGGEYDKSGEDNDESCEDNEENNMDMYEVSD